MITEVWAAPEHKNVVDWVNVSNPGLIKHDDMAFLNLVLKDLNKINGEQGMWGYNGKRGNPNDKSRDCVAYLNSAIPWGCSIVDIIGGHADNDPNANPTPAWIDQTRATAANGTTGLFIPYNDVSVPPVDPPVKPPTNKCNCAMELDLIQLQLVKLENQFDNMFVVLMNHVTDQSREVVRAVTSEANRVITETNDGSACKVRPVLRG